MNTIRNSNVYTNKILSFEHFLLIVCAASTLLILGWLLKYSNYGFDFTDEGYYLVWISNPFIYDWSTSEFGFIYYPLYRLVNGSVATLRQANILITFCLAWLLFETFFKKFVCKGFPWKARYLVISSGFATASLVFVVPWLPTPSYNSLALQALLIAGTGLLLAESIPSYSSVVGWLMIATGGWLAFMAKPSTAVALGLLVILYILSARKFNARLAILLLASTISLLVLSALFIDGVITDFIVRLRLGVELSRLSGAGYTFSQIIRLGTFQLTLSEKWLFFLIATASFLAAYLLYISSRLIMVIAAALSTVFFLVVAILILGFWANSIDFSQFSRLLVFSVPFSAIMLALSLSNYKLFYEIPSSYWLLALLFISFPYVYIFGSNGNYWQGGGSAAVFWLLSGLILIVPTIQNKITFSMLVPLVGATQVVVTLIIQTGMNAPYRQPQALQLNSHIVEVGAPGSSLLLSEAYATYINKAITSAKRSGFSTGTPVIDLTGQSPGLLYALRAVNLGYPWIAGGYPGSEAVARAALRRVPCTEVVSAWLLLEPSGPRAISTDLLNDIGAILLEDYQLVAAWKTAKGSGGYAVQRLQQLAKPTRARDNALQACEAMREN